MRALPLAFLAPEHQVRLSEESADFAHPRPKARAASLLVAFAARFLFDGGNAAELLSAALADLEGSRLADDATIEHLRRLDELPDYHEYGERFAGMPPGGEVHEILCGPQPVVSPYAVSYTHLTLPTICSV